MAHFSRRMANHAEELPPCRIDRDDVADRLVTRDVTIVKCSPFRDPPAAFSLRRR